MAYFLLEDFRRGLDKRKLRNTLPSGSLVTCNNAYINQGGEIEKRKAFGQNADLNSKLAGIVAAGGRWLGPIDTGADSITFLYYGAPKPTNGAAYGVTYTWTAAPAEPTFGGGAYLGEIVYSAPYGANVLVVVAQGVSYRQLYGPIEGTLAFIVSGTTPIDNGAGLVLKDKAYRASINASTVFSFSAVGTPAVLTGTGSGSVDASKQGGALGFIKGLGEYFGQLVVFGSQSAQVWQVDPDPAQYQFVQAIAGISLMSPHAVTPYADGDLLFLDASGIRSLQARDSSNFAATGDIGSPIDQLVTTALHENVTTEWAYAVMATARGMVERQLGQFWLLLEDKAYVLSRFPAADVRAWSTYTLPMTSATDRVTAQAQLRGVHCFGTYEGEVWFFGEVAYDSTLVEVETPHLDFAAPATTKVFQSLDLACLGDWTVEVSFDPDNIVWETVATVSNSTFGRGRIELTGASTHIALRLTTTSAGAARLAQIVLHYEEAEAG